MLSTNNRHEPHILTELHEIGLTGLISEEPDVLIEIVELTVQEFGGLILIASKRRTRGKTLDLSGSGEISEGGRWHTRNGIKVQLEAATIDVEIDISVQSEANLPQLAADLKSRIDQAFDRLLGLKIGAVGIHVVEIVPCEDYASR